MEKITITREELKAYPKNKKPIKNYHKIIVNKAPAEKSVPTVKMLYQVRADNAENR